MSACPNYIPALSVVDSPIEGRVVASMFEKWEFLHYIELQRTDLTTRIAMLFHAEGEPIAVFLQTELVALPDRRIDILIETMDSMLIVELDGAKFHCSPNTMRRDREKDREALLKGIATLRFMGKDVWDNPGKCVDQIRMVALEDPCRDA